MNRVVAETKSFQLSVQVLWQRKLSQTASSTAVKSWAPSSYGRRATAAGRLTTATATATPTQSSRYPSARRRKEAGSPGTLRSARQPWPRPIRQVKNFF